MALESRGRISTIHHPHTAKGGQDRVHIWYHAEIRLMRILYAKSLPTYSLRVLKWLKKVLKVCGAKPGLYCVDG
jgi:hypothetical protein